MSSWGPTSSLDGRRMPRVRRVMGAGHYVSNEQRGPKKET